MTEGSSGTQMFMDRTQRVIKEANHIKNLIEKVTYAIRTGIGAIEDKARALIKTLDIKMSRANNIKEDSDNAF